MQYKTPWTRSVPGKGAQNNRISNIQSEPNQKLKVGSIFFDIFFSVRFKLLTDFDFSIRLGLDWKKKSKNQKIEFLFILIIFRCYKDFDCLDMI